METRQIFMQQRFADLQVARFNEIYYRRRAELFRRLSLWSNIVSSVAASASLAGQLKAIPGVGDALLQGLTALAALAAIVGPIAGWDATAAKFEQSALGHGIVHDRLRRLLGDLRTADLTEAHQAREIEIEAVRAALSALDEPPAKGTHADCWAAALAEYPSEQAWTVV